MLFLPKFHSISPNHSIDHRYPNYKKKQCDRHYNNKYKYRNTHRNYLPTLLFNTTQDTKNILDVLKNTYMKYM